MSDFIHKRKFIVYSPLVEPTPMYGLHHFCDTGSLEIFESVNEHQTVEQYSEDEQELCRQKI